MFIYLIIQQQDNKKFLINQIIVIINKLLWYERHLTYRPPCVYSILLWSISYIKNTYGLTLMPFTLWGKEKAPIYFIQYHFTKQSKIPAKGV